MNQNVLEKAENWCKRNIAMPSIETPKGYKSEYLYQQAVIYEGEISENPPFEFCFAEKDGWGVISVALDNELSEKELNKWKSAIEKRSFLCIGSMRLIKQTFTWKGQ